MRVLDSALGHLFRLVLPAMILWIAGGMVSAAEMAAPATPLASVAIEQGSITCTSLSGDEGAVLTVSGPGEIWFREEIRAGIPLVIDLVDAAGRTLPDGQYTYEIRQVPAIDARTREILTEARESGDETAVIERLRDSGQLPLPVPVQSGAFSVRAGAFVTGGPPETGESAAAAPRSGRSERIQVRGGDPSDEIVSDPGGTVTIAPRDYQILDDLIVDGSQCVGNDCVDGESFGYDTIRLKENNLRIAFMDTSAIQSYPTNDWQIVANDSVDGGLDKFSIDDIDGGRTPFTIEAGARSHALYVDRYGRLGIGTSAPVVEVHTVDGDTPTVRLEQNSSSGWPAQTFDVAGNEQGFFIRDATNGSRLPFRIESGAPSSTLHLRAGGDVTFAANLILVDGATVDGRDVSADGARLDAIAPVAGLAGILDASSFDLPDQAQATWDWFAAQTFGEAVDQVPATAAVVLDPPLPEGQNYVVLLTAVTSDGSAQVHPVLMPGRDRFGFTVSLGTFDGAPAADPRRDVVEVHWAVHSVE